MDDQQLGVALLALAAIAFMLGMVPPAGLIALVGIFLIISSRGSKRGKFTHFP